jgi:hypothetical protein
VGVVGGAGAVTVTVEAPVWTERQEVEHWKHERFKELGFDDGEAQWLVMVGVDWHEAQRLILRGCDLVMVKRILSPVEPPTGSSRKERTIRRPDREKPKPAASA